MSGKSFRRNFFDLSIGMFIAQLLSFAFMPVISRLYLPAEMGEYALYVAISSIVGLVANLRMDLAVVVGKNETEADELASLGLISSFASGVLCFIGLIIWRGLDEFTIMTSFSAFAIGGIQTVAQWHNRQQQYRVLAARNVGEKMLVLAAGLLFGFYGYTQWGLIVAQTLGLTFAFIYFYAKSRLAFPPQAHLKLIHTAKAFSDFPTMNLISSLALSMAFFLPNILFAAYFTKDQLGYYSLIVRLFDVPINLFAYTFNTVYYQYSAKTAPTDRLRLFTRSLKFLSLALGPPFIIIAAFGTPLVTLFFGANWAEAGALALWLAPYTLFRLLYVTQSALLLSSRKLKVEMLVSLALCLSQIGGFFAGYWWNANPVTCVATMSTLGILVYVGGLISVYRAVK